MADSSDRRQLSDLVARMRAARDAIAGLESALAAGEPWALSDAFGVEPEAHWGPPETLAHLAEMLPYWTGEVERVVAGEPEPVPFGRVASDRLRIGLIERDRTLPARELFARIDAGVERLAGRLTALTPEQAARRGVHPTLGEMDLAAIVERFVAGHLEEHARQLREALPEG